jgi:hypothetical protein
MPTQIAPGKRIINAFRTGKTINYTYENDDPKVPSPDRRIDLAEKIKVLCSGENTRTVLDIGYAYASLDVDRNGNFLARYYVDRSMCR